MKWFLLALHLIIVHAPNGDEIELNTNEVSSLREPRDAEGHYHKDVNCVIFMTNGRFISATESCKDIHAMLEAAK
jgi:hypothetical protein